MSRSFIRIAATTFTLVVAVANAFATQVIQVSPQELAKDSQLVVDGKVASVRSYWNNDRSKIFTEATVMVGSTYKGGAASSVRVVQPGGVVGNVRMTAQGALQWKKGEEVLLFLEPSLPGAYQVAGFSQGKYMIERDARTGKAFVKQAQPADAKDKSATPQATSAAGRVELKQFVDSALSNQ